MPMMWNRRTMTLSQSASSRTMLPTLWQCAPRSSAISSPIGSFERLQQQVPGPGVQIVPLSRRIAEENLLRYNGMLIGVFELLVDARAQIASVNASIDALRTSGWRRPIST
jgi:hypothetical protein